MWRGIDNLIPRSTIPMYDVCYERQKKETNANVYDRIHFVRIVSCGLTSKWAAKKAPFAAYFFHLIPL